MGGGDSQSQYFPDKQTNASSNLVQNLQYQSGSTSLQSQIVDQTKRRMQDNSVREIVRTGELHRDTDESSRQIPLLKQTQAVKPKNSITRYQAAPLEVIQEKRKGQPLTGDDSVADEEFIRSVEENEVIVEEASPLNQLANLVQPARSINSGMSSPHQSLHFPPKKLTPGLSFPDSKEEGFSLMNRDARLSRDHLGRSTASLRDTFNGSRYSPRKSMFPTPTLAPEYEQVIKSTGLTTMSFSDRSISKTFSRKSRVEHNTNHDTLNNSSEINESRHDHTVTAIKDLETLKLRRNRSIQPELIGDIGNIRIVHLLENLQKEIDKVGNENSELDERIKLLEKALSKREDNKGQYYLESVARLQQTLQERLRDLTTRNYKFEEQMEQINQSVKSEVARNHKLDIRLRDLRGKVQIVNQLQTNRQDFDKDQMLAVFKMKMMPSQAMVDVFSGQISKILVDQLDPDVRMSLGRALALERSLGI